MEFTPTKFQQGLEAPNYSVEVLHELDLGADFMADYANLQSLCVHKYDSTFKHTFDVNRLLNQR